MRVFYIMECIVFFFKQKTAYEMRISDWSSDVCSSDLGKDFEKLAKRLPESYWIAEPVEVIAANMLHIQQAGNAPLHIAAVPDDDRGATLVKLGRASCRERVCQYV